MTFQCRPARLAALAGILVAGELAAQAAPGPAIRLLGGVSAASLADGSGNTDPIYGVAVGAQFVLPRSARWGVAAELLLVEKGGSESVGTASVDADLRTLDLSVLALWQGGAAQAPRRIAVFGGPTVGYILSCNAGSGVGSVFVTGDCLANVNRTDLGLTVGAGMDFPGGDIDWGIALRYQHGLADLLREDGTLRTRTLQLLLSYRL